MLFISIKEINRIISKECQVFTGKLENVTHLKLQVSFWGAWTDADIIEFSNFLLQLKNQKSGSKTMYGFSIILIWKHKHERMKNTRAYV